MTKPHYIYLDSSGAGTNLKWGAPVRCKSGGTDLARSAEKIFIGVPLHLFGSKSAISRFGERFRDGQYSLASFLFAFLVLMMCLVPRHL